MGVMNLTPNSFSDGNCLSTDAAIQERFQHLFNNQVEAVDLGFESTAPMNASLSLEQELERVYSFLDLDLSLLLKFKIISIDTYRPQVVETILLALLKQNFSGRLLWNDISGQLDGEALLLLQKYSNLDYVFCHNLSNSRETGSAHMTYKSNGPLDLKAYFLKALDHFKTIDSDRVWFDPCFGFSKDQGQNIELLKELPHLIASFGDSRPWVVGLSRKSFMRSFIEEIDGNLTREELLSYSEYFHILAISHFRNVSNPLYFRVHNPLVVTVSDKFLHLF